MRRIGPLSIAAAALCLAAAPACRAAYEVLDVADFQIEQGFHLHSASRINNAGDIAGQARFHDSTRRTWPALVRADRLRLIDGPPGSKVVGLNDAGMAVGLAPKDERFVVVVWEKPGEPRRELAVVAGAKEEQPRAISRSGVIVGYAFMADAAPTGFVAAPGQPPIVLGAGFLPVDVNGKGQVVGATAPSMATNKGERAFFWEDGRMRELPPLAAAAPGSSATAINEAGQAAGCAKTASGNYVPVLWNADGAIVGLLRGDEKDWRNEKGTVFGCARAMNGAGVVVGLLSTPRGDEAFIWDAAHGLRNLNDVATPWVQGWSRFTEAASINDRGEIIGTAEALFDGRPGTFLLRPSDDPFPNKAFALRLVAVALCAFAAAVAVGVLLRRRFRRRPLG
jgi:probable HAF family extracellular repeat protein